MPRHPDGRLRRDLDPPDYVAGWDAHEEGVPAWENPHSAAREPDRFALWREGWGDAEDHHEDEGTYRDDEDDEDFDDEPDEDELEAALADAQFRERKLAEKIADAEYKLRRALGAPPHYRLENLVGEVERRLKQEVRHGAET